MQTFIMLTRLAPEAARSPHGVETLAHEVMSSVRSECPQVEWLHSYALMGPHDYLDVFRAPDVETAMKVATLIRIFGHSHTEVWPATEWKTYKVMLRELPESSGLVRAAH
jgi:uncharacterized protein with GYD domain